MADYAGGAEAPQRASRGLLLPACVGLGSVALLATAGPLPALYLAAGGAGGWFIGKRLRGGGGGAKSPLDVPDEEEADTEDSEDESDEDDEVDLDEAAEEEAAGAAAVAPYLFSFLRQLKEGGGGGAANGSDAAAAAASDPAAAEDRAAIEAGLHEVFTQLPRERVEELMQAFGPRQGPPSTQGVQSLQAAIAEITGRLPPAAATAMERQSARFLPAVAAEANPLLDAAS
mmetsp:Transcript_117980/g.328778  ORF Transcript_117980/g.328778 Transcript_117980/m.328778 type:complete len:230 (-) Transcript_117980:65-754(-)